MSARPVVSSNNNKTYPLGDNSIHLILIDDTYSSKFKDNNIIKILKKITSSIPENSRLIISTLTENIIYDGTKSEYLNKSINIKRKYLSGNFLNSFLIVDNIVKDKNASKELIIISDSQASSFKGLFNNHASIKDWRVFYYDTGIREDVWFTDFKFKNDIFNIGRPIDIELKLLNTKKIKLNNQLLTLTINDELLGQQIVKLEHNQEKFYNFATSSFDIGNNLSKIMLENDIAKEKKEFYFNININDKPKIAILVDGSSKDLVYINNALKILNINIEEINALSDFQFTNNGLINFDAIIVQNPKAIESMNIQLLEDYVYDGGHLIVFPSNIDQENMIINQFKNIHSIEDFSIKNESNTDVFEYIDFKLKSNAGLNNLFYDKNVKVFKYIELPFSFSNSILRIGKNKSIWNRYEVGSGVIDISGFRLNLSWTNFPIKGEFLQFINFIVNSVSYSNNTSWFYTDTLTNINLPLELTGKNIFHIKPSGLREIINYPIKGNIEKVFTEPGFHKFEYDNKIIKNVSVNITKNEINNKYINFNNINNYFPETAYISNDIEELSSFLAEKRYGYEIWRFLLYLIVFICCLEMYISNVAFRKR